MGHLCGYSSISSNSSIASRQVTAEGPNPKRRLYHSCRWLWHLLFLCHSQHSMWLFFYVDAAVSAGCGIQRVNATATRHCSILLLVFAAASPSKCPRAHTVTSHNEMPRPATSSSCGIWLRRYVSRDGERAHETRHVRAVQRHSTDLTSIYSLVHLANKGASGSSTRWCTAAPPSQEPMMIDGASVVLCNCQLLTLSSLKQKYCSR